MEFLDFILGGWKRYRQWRGGIWNYANCVDGGWFRNRDPKPDFPVHEDYRRPKGQA